MKFSIIIPVYNVAKYLPACLDSIMEQSFADFEVICVNDGSTDDSLVVLEEYAAKFPQLRIVNQENAGTAAARNHGVMEAKGDYVWFVDSDDWVETDALQILSQNITDEDMLCFSGRRYFEVDDSTEASDFMAEEQGLTGWEYYNRHALEHRNFAFVCVVLRVYKRDFLLRNNLFFDKGVTHEDNLWVPLVCYYAKTVRVISNSLYVYRIRMGSKMGDNVSLARKKDLLSVANELSEFFVPKIDIDKIVVYRSVTQHYQAVFQNTKPEDDKVLLPMVNWELYKTVSRTKMRHRVLYFALRVSPKVFRLALNKL